MISDFTKKVIYILELIIFYFIQEIPNLSFDIYNNKPIFLIPVFMSIVIFEKNYSIMIFGIITGFLLDLGSTNSIGFHTFIFCIIGYLFKFILDFYIKRNFFVTMTLGFFITILVLALRFLFFYVFKFYDNVLYTITYHILLCGLYTISLIPIFYYINKKINCIAE
ncbi:MAG: rod shape-determining protein MreD [Candidatus Paraimprobicoccus trichonymphae]|uniref:Rod shape-determining protein MreD n=1 Tax=Candidatus Paraimprobicoccus trichonymphae TaxID=3033793 RepID=A0AA48L1F8_9FIRM|nr:MAG: rod shape-determining protein MreD [Candidatus Paraimprobicoccus trichonymphae]